MDTNTARINRACSIGAGRMGRALLMAGRRSGIEPVGAWSYSPRSRTTLAAELGCATPDSLEQLVRGADVIFVAVPDDAVAQVLDELAGVAASSGHRPLVLVTSGAVRIDAQSERVARSLRIARLHPFQTVTPSSADNVFDGVTAAITARHDRERLNAWNVALGLGMRPVDLADEHAATWHAAGVLASGAVATLIAVARDLASDAGIEPDRALEAVTSLAASTVERCRIETPEHALTGPVLRADTGTIAAHLDALAAQHPELVDAYVAMARLTSSTALKAGRIDGTDAMRIEQVLRLEQVLRFDQIGTIT